MRSVKILLGGAAALLVFAGAAAGEHRLVERWEAPDHESGKSRRLLVIAIADDQEARRNFENKFVSHLRGIGVDGVTSHSLVADLTSVENIEALRRILEDREIDGAISVRAVPLKGLGEEAWGDAWRQAVEGDGNLRALVDETLPLKEQKSKRYGVEVALWQTASRERVWAARTNSYTRKEMREGAGEFVQFVMQALRLAGLL